MQFLMNKNLKRWKSYNLPNGTYLTTYLGHCIVSEYGEKIILATSLTENCVTHNFIKNQYFLKQ